MLKTQITSEPALTGEDTIHGLLCHCTGTFPVQSLRSGSIARTRDNPICRWPYTAYAILGSKDEEERYLLAYRFVKSMTQILFCETGSFWWFRPLCPSDRN